MRKAIIVMTAYNNKTTSQPNIHSILFNTTIRIIDAEVTIKGEGGLAERRLIVRGMGVLETTGLFQIIF